MTNPSNPQIPKIMRPRSLVLSALFFAAAGLACLVFFSVSNLGNRAPLWIGASLVVTGIGLSLGRPWGRGLASAIIFCGYLASAFYLLSATHPTDKTPLEIWQAYGLVFLAVAVLTFVSGSLWSRSVSAYFNRFSHLAKTKRI